MFKDLRIFRRNFGKNPTAEANNENIPACPDDLASFQLESDHSRPPLNTIQEPVQNPKFGSDQEARSRRTNEQTPSKSHVRGHDAVFQFRTPEKATAVKNRFGCGPKGEEPGPSCTEDCEDSLQPGTYLLRPPPYPPASHLLNLGNVGAFCASTPRAVRAGGKASSVQSGTSSTQSTPTKSVTKPSITGNGSHRIAACGGTTRGVNLSVPCKGMPISSVSTIVYAPTEVPHFELKEDPSFWMEHNVQVVIRIRPLNTMEKNLQGYTRCIKQDNAQSITMIGQSDTRFIFDYVACETVNQEMLFRVAGLPIVENCISGYNSCVFAYGQTGSGKTYTMLGEINDMEITPSANRGMTPRIFEFLFARIRAEEESRRDEKLQYHCKCSFLEIYNEQITDLLDPSSTNLLIREDLRKGVYVENLTEFEVENVNDIIKLLIQGASNRKVAATNMNRESSRSHSVFTCTIESRWENDSTSNMRFARLNLVDLAGSERQKTSGAEGCRLKEAANINRSLSTLGHVIMVLADVASGRQRHIPYRDSRLTFLLQDSLGGNSKTMIIANVSPSVCSTNETLSTLKFAQRAKLIQNNAVVNENTSNDVVALQHQIHLLKEELSMLKRQNVSRSLSFYTAIGDVESNASSPQRLHCSQPSVDQVPGNEEECSLRVSTKKLKSLEATLAGALRREKMAEIATRQLEAEIQQLNRLVSQREEDIQCSKMMIKFREDKVLRMEAVLNGLMSSESYESEENKALSKEMSLLRAKVDRNPEVTRFALENIRLLEQLRKFQDFYEEGERELLLTEVSDLRNQLLQVLSGKSEQEQPFKSDPVQEHKQLQHSNSINEEESLRAELKRVSLELDDCRNNLNSCLEINAKLAREINNLNIQLNKINHASPENNMDLPLAFPGKLPYSYSMKHIDEVLNLELELDILKTIIAEEKSYRIEAEERATHVNAELSTSNESLLKISKKYDETNDKLKDARSVIEALESQQVLYINELDELRQHNNQLENILKKQGDEISALRKQLGFPSDEGNKQVTVYETLKGSYIERECSPLQMKLKSMQASLEKAWNLNLRFQTDQECQTSNEREMDEVRRQVEAETAEVILCLQEELSTLHQLVDDSNKNELLAKQYQMDLETQRKELDGKVYQLTLENTRLATEVEEKEQKLRSVMKDWEKLVCEITGLLENGNGDLDIVTYEVASISDAFSHQRWIGEQFVKIIRGISERDSLVEELQKSLEDAQNVRHDMELKLRSLRGATLAISEAQQQESSDKESQILYLTSLLSEKLSVISELESQVELAKNQIRQAEISAPDVHLLDRDNLQPKESEMCILQKDSFMHDRVCHDLGTQPEQCYKQKDLVEQQQQALALNVQCKDAGNPTSFENSDDFMGAKMELEEFQMEMRALKSCISEYVDNRSNTEEEEHSSGKHSFESADFNSEEEGLYKQKDLVEQQQQELALIVQWKDDGNPTSLKNSDDFMGAKMELEEFPMETRALKSCINEYVENRSNTEEEERSSGKHSSEAADFNTEDRAIIGTILRLPERVPDRERTIIMLRGEMRTALDSLREVQCQMAQMFEEKDKNRKAMMLSQDSIKCLRDEVHRLNAEVLHKENNFKLQLLKMEDELQAAKENVVAFNCSWRNEKELLELEISNAKAVAAHKTMEATNLLLKIEEAQGAMQDAEVMVNALTKANEAAKVEIEGLKKSEMSLYREKCSLISQLHDLKASLDEKDESFECIQKYCKLNIMEANSLVIALEDLKDHFAEKISLITNDLQGLKSQMLQHKELARLWLEEIWLDSIGKDSALSVVCLCHLQVLQEQITELNAENHFLRNVLCESNSLVSNLRQNYEKAQKEVHMCSILKGKLLLDSNASFAQITRSENEISELNAKLNSFEKKIVSLQLLEETMLEKSNSIGAELDILKLDYDAHKEKCLKAAFPENVFRENEKINKLQMMMSLSLVEGQVTNEILRDELDIELKKKFEVTKSVEQQLFDMNLLLAQRTYVLDDLRKEMECIKHKNVDLESHVSTLKEKLELARAVVEDNEAIAAERLENLLMENKELERELMEMSKLLDEVQETNEIMRKNLSKASDENNIAIEMLKEELLETWIMLGQRDHLVEVLQKDLSRVAEEKDHLESAAYIWKEKLDIAITVTEVMVENEQLKLQLEEMKKMLDQVQDINRNLLEESVGNSIASEILRKELLDLNILLGNKAQLLQELQNEITEHTKVKQQLECQVSILKEKLELAEACAEENEAMATEARQIAEDSKAYAVDKDEEIKLLESSVEELEFTVNALQEQVRIVKEEAEMQRLKMSEFEMGQASVRHSESLEDKLAELESAQLNIQLLQKEVVEKEVEIVQCKSLIAELSLHAEAQAREYKQKFQELEAMAVDVKSEQVLSNSTGLMLTKTEKGTGKSRGSGSPFKCIGLGVQQQINIEKDEELSAAKRQIEELEALAASRQKQIFVLNARLAAAESMTHDVLRDLLSIKLDMTKYAKVNERSQSENAVSLEEDHEFWKLKKQVDEFIEERQKWLDQINQQQRELNAAQMKLERVQEHVKKLAAENELLKAGNAKYMNLVMELEDELEKTLVNSRLSACS